MTSLFMLLLAWASQGPPPPPPPDLTPHRELALARRDQTQKLALQALSFTIRKPLRPGEKTPLGPPIKLSSAQRSELLRLLADETTYSETPGVFGCAGREYELTLDLPNRQLMSWFCSRCERLFSVVPEHGQPGFDAALSEHGSQLLRRFFATVVRGGRAR